MLINVNHSKNFFIVIYALIYNQYGYKIFFFINNINQRLNSNRMKMKKLKNEIK
jgi:hypothetical protein